MDTKQIFIKVKIDAEVSLHLLAQKDLVHSFENLATKNQIIHATHSPFLVDTGNIDRVKVVYLYEEAYTFSLNDLIVAEAHSTTHAFAQI